MFQPSSHLHFFLNSSNLEQILNVSFEKSDLKTVILCQGCFQHIEKFDELQQQAEEVQNNLCSIFSNSRIEEVYIKSEVEEVPTIVKEELEEETLIRCNSNGNLKLKCKKCQSYFSNIKDMMDHSHEFHPSKETSQPAMSTRSKSKPLKVFGTTRKDVSLNFKQVASKEGINYSFDSFRDAFFSEKEKGAIKDKDKILDQPIRTHYVLKADIRRSDELVSNSFKSFAEKSGISYNLESFQKAFGYSEGEKSYFRDAPPPKKPASFSSNTTSTATKKTSNNKTWINDNFIAAMKDSGVNYDLQTFQKAFGFVDASETVVETLEEEEFKTLERIADTGSRIQCPHCSESFSKKFNFVNHLKIHRPVNPDFYCYECKKQFRTEDGIRVHRASDHGRIRGPLTCPVCKKIYSDRVGLKNHLLIHHQENRFLCGHCGAFFTNNRAFKSHSLIHTDIKPYLCSYPDCGKRFRCSSKQKIHERVHTGEKLYECPFCPGKRFAVSYLNFYLTFILLLVSF